MTPHAHRWQRTPTDQPLAAGTHLHTCRDCGLTTQAPDAVCACRRPCTREDHPKVVAEVRARERAAFAALLDAEDDEDERTGR
jgi:hypothetical protein